MCLLCMQPLLVLAGVLVVNMVLLAPHLHVHGPSSSSSAAAGWHQQGGQAAAGSGSVQAGTQNAAGSSRQQGVKAPQNDLWTDFDSNQDGVLEPAEFQALLQVGVPAQLSTSTGTAQPLLHSDTSKCVLDTNPHSLLAWLVGSSACMVGNSWQQCKATHCHSTTQRVHPPVCHYGCVCRRPAGWIVHPWVCCPGWSGCCACH